MAKIKKQNNQDIIFHLPGIFNYSVAYKELLPLLQRRPEILRKNVKIGSIYGSPNCIWNGGRAIYNFYTKELLIQIKKFMEELNIPVRFTFTNCLIEEKHLLDTYGNLILDVFNNGKNEIICNSEILENYIRDKYGDRYKYISSTTKRLTSKKEQSEELRKDQYHLVVLDYDHNKDFVYLKNLDNKHKCEILCNPVCQPNCERRLDHYQSISRCQLDFSEYNYVCHDSEKSFWMSQSNSNFISVKDINTVYMPMGFNNFKLEGRTASPLSWIEIILYYLIRDDYKLEVREFLQKILL